MTRTRVLAALLAGLTLAGLGTAATALGSDDPASTPPPVTVVAQTRAATPASALMANAPAPDAVSADEAGARAVAHLGGGAVTKVEREVEHGRTVWKVDVRRDSRLTEAHVDVATGTVTRIKDDRTDGDRSDDHGGRHGNDDGPGHDRFDDKGGDR